MSATNGRLLWATDLVELYDNLSFVSTPAVVGRYCYAAARKRQRDAPEQLVLLALETTTGVLLWEATLGELSDRIVVRRDRETPGEWNDLFAGLTAPAVDADHVYLNPGGQSLLAIDRFTGRLRWLHQYDEASTELPRNDRLKSARREALQRFRTTPVPTGGLVLSAPRDSLRLLAVSRIDGRGVWTCGVSSSGTLVGAADGIAVLASVDAVHGVRVADGTVAWTNPVSGARRPTGPGVIFEGAYYAPMPQGVFAFSLQSGESTPTAIPRKRVPAFRDLLSAAPLRAAMIQAGIVEAFLLSREDKADRED
jgi:outer membrane protein assembly factor BamB